MHANARMSSGYNCRPLLGGQALRDTWARRRSAAHQHYRHPQADPLRYPQSRSYSGRRHGVKTPSFRRVETSAGAGRDVRLGRERALATLLERVLLQDGTRLCRRRHRRQQRRRRWGRQQGGRRGRLQRQRWWGRHRRLGALGTTTPHLLGQPEEDARARTEL